jgi:hypothetical protein
MQTLFRAIANGGALNGEDQVVDMAAGNGKPVDISDLFFRFTLDAATDFLLGYDVKSLRFVSLPATFKHIQYSPPPSNPRQEFAEAFGEVQRIQSIISRAGAAQGIIPRGAFNKNMKVINKFVNLYIERTLRLSPEELAGKSKSDAGYTFLHALAGYTRDHQVLRDQLIAVLLAGRDTTACTLSWTVYELARHPEALEKLRAEILSVVGPTRAPTYDDLKSMKYLQNVMNETLRLYPVVPFKYAPSPYYHFPFPLRPSSLYIRTNTPVLSASASPSKTRPSPAAAALPASTPSKSSRTRPSPTQHWSCSGAPTCTRRRAPLSPPSTSSRPTAGPPVSQQSSPNSFSLFAALGWLLMPPIWQQKIIANIVDRATQTLAIRPLQRRAAHLHRPAVCPDRDGLRADKAVSAV